MTIRSHFDRELDALSTDLIKMGAMASEAIDRAMEALKNRDHELARQVVAYDDKVDEMERSIEQQCLRLLLRQQPVAGDLRKISTAIKMITDIERIGDGAADIAGISLYLGDHPLASIEPKVFAMAATARDMVAASIDSYVSGNLDLARKTIRRDDVVDRAFDELKALIAEEIARDMGCVDAAMDYLMIIKYLERLGDHAVNICEWVEFYMTGIHKEEKIL